MTGNEDYFVDLDQSMKTQVRLGNKNYVQVSGMGTVEVLTSSGKKHIHNVMYAIGLTDSVGQLIRRGYYVIFDIDECKIFDKRRMKMIYSVKMTENQMFPVFMSKLMISYGGKVQKHQVENLEKNQKKIQNKVL